MFDDKRVKTQQTLGYGGRVTRSNIGDRQRTNPEFTISGTG